MVFRQRILVLNGMYGDDAVPLHLLHVLQLSRISVLRFIELYLTSIHWKYSTI